MANEPMWKTFGHNAVCSIRRCHRRPSKRLDLAVVGTQRYGSFGNKGPWTEVVGVVHIVVCDQCYEMIHETNIDVIRRIRSTSGFSDYLLEFASQPFVALRKAVKRVLESGWDYHGDMTEVAAEDPKACEFMSAMEGLAAEERRLDGPSE